VSLDEVIVEFEQVRFGKLEVGLDTLTLLEVQQLEVFQAEFSHSQESIALTKKQVKNEHRISELESRLKQEADHAQNSQQEESQETQQRLSQALQTLAGERGQLLEQSLKLNSTSPKKGETQ
jgi:DNA anti-recombination protein RmuC